MSEWDGGRKAAALLSVLTGNARELARTIPPAVILNGGVINGQAVDSVTFIMHSLAQRYARLGEEQRLEAIQGLLSFDRHSGERIDALLQRFDGARIKAQEHGNLVLSPQGLSWLLLRAVGVSEHQLLNLLATPPLNGNLPADDQGMEALKSALRRMGHIVERTPGNVASSMNRPNQRFNQAYFILVRIWHKAQISSRTCHGRTLNIILQCQPMMHRHRISLPHTHMTPQPHIMPMMIRVQIVTHHPTHPLFMRRTCQRSSPGRNPKRIVFGGRIAVQSRLGVRT